VGLALRRPDGRGGIAAIGRAIITRERAEQIALEHARGTELGTGIGEVKRLDETPWRPAYLFIASERLAQCWMGYVTTERQGFRLESSTVVVIHAQSGRMEYSGSAGDEG
jgi:hypothetical protein